MFGIGIRMLRIPHECLELAFDCFKSLDFAFLCFQSRSNGWNWHSSALNGIEMIGIGILLLRMLCETVVIGIWILQISFECLEFAFECFESCSNGWNWHSSVLNPVRMVGIGILMLWVPFKWLELAFECFESCSNGWNWHSSAIQTVGIGILMFRMLCEMVGIGIRILQIPFEWLEFAFECFKCLSNGLN